jgi:3-oxoacyl-[acyl-carrier-protein] synthase I
MVSGVCARFAGPDSGPDARLTILAPPQKQRPTFRVPNPIAPLAITAYTATTAAGRGLDAFASALAQRTSGLVPNDVSSQPLSCWIGRVAGLDEAPLPQSLARWDSRNHRVAWIALNCDGFLERARAAIERYGASRVALVLGTSTSSMSETERVYRELDADGRMTPAQRVSLVHQTHALGAFVQHVFGVRGPCLTIATACSSSAKVFASAARMIHSGIVDAAIVGGVDSLCDSVLFGFNALELVSAQPCRPFDVDRNGLSLGEAAGFALLEAANVNTAAPRLVGYGESADAHHMSAPHPQGLGAQRALEDALARSALTPADVDYINLHGTASRQNDEIEAALIARAFPARTLASSTKGWTGHALGAAGIVEAVVALLAIERGLVPGTLNSEHLDPACGPQITLDNHETKVRVALSNSFGFGGNNCCLAFAAGNA